MSRVRVHNFSVSLDGFGTGEGQSLDAPFGHAGDRLQRGSSPLGPSTPCTASPAAARAQTDNPVFHPPVFVLTHHPRPSLEMEGGTTFHFLDADPAEALAAARQAAGGLDIRIGGGPPIIR